MGSGAICPVCESEFRFSTDGDKLESLYEKWEQAIQREMHERLPDLTSVAFRELLDRHGAPSITQAQMDAAIATEREIVWAEAIKIADTPRSSTDHYGKEQSIVERLIRESEVMEDENAEPGSQSVGCSCICHGLIMHCNRCSGSPCRAHESDRDALKAAMVAKVR